MFLVKGLRPMATSTTSASKLSAPPPLAPSRDSFTPSPVTSEPTT